MNKVFIKKFILGIFVIIFITNFFVNVSNSTAIIDNSSIEKKELSNMDQKKTYIDLNQNPEYINNSEIIVVGDSFSYLFVANCGEKINYVVHQGYNIRRINEELMDLIPNLKFRHCFLFLGPNDYMEQTDIFQFQKQLQETFNKAHDRNMDVIVTSYFEPNHDDENAKALMFCTTPCYIYEMIIKDTAERNGFIFMDIKDLFIKYGHQKGDFVHPNREINKEILKRLLTYID